MTDRSLSALRCPSCGGGPLRIQSGGAITCRACAHAVRVEQGIPILARDWQAVEADVEQARAVRPTWYEEEQPPEVASPWRHHLRKRREFVQSAIGDYLRQRRETTVPRLLDLGCGDGNNLVWLSAFAADLYGTDYNLMRLVRARARNAGATIVAADLMDFPSEGATFDIIFFNHVIEHVPEDVKALAEVRRILKPGGLLVLGTPNEGAWWWQWAYRRDPASLRNTDHVHFYTAETIASRMSAAGLTVTRVHHMGWGPPDWRLDGRIRKYKLVDDGFELLGRLFLQRQASSLYLLATTP